MNAEIAREHSTGRKLHVGWYLLGPRLVSANSRTLALQSKRDLQLPRLVSQFEATLRWLAA